MIGTYAASAQLKGRIQNVGFYATTPSTSVTQRPTYFNVNDDVDGTTGGYLYAISILTPAAVNLKPFVVFADWITIGKVSTETFTTVANAWKTFELTTPLYMPEGSNLALVCTTGNWSPRVWSNNRAYSVSSTSTLATIVEGGSLTSNTALPQIGINFIGHLWSDQSGYQTIGTKKYFQLGQMMHGIDPPTNAGVIYKSWMNTTPSNGVQTFSTQGASVTGPEVYGVEYHLHTGGNVAFFTCSTEGTFNEVSETVDLPAGRGTYMLNTPLAISSSRGEGIGIWSAGTALPATTTYQASGVNLAHWGTTSGAKPTNGVDATNQFNQNSIILPLRALIRAT